MQRRLVKSSALADGEATHKASQVQCDLHGRRRKRAFFGSRILARARSTRKTQKRHIEIGTHYEPCRMSCRGAATCTTERPGLFNNLFMTRRGGGVILQTASQHAFSSAKICKFSQKISNISPRFCKIQRILTIICVLPQFLLEMPMLHVPQV